MQLVDSIKISVVVSKENSQFRAHIAAQGRHIPVSTTMVA